MYEKPSLEELVHAEDFKYYYKLKINDKYRYFYSKEEYDAYNNKQTSTNKVSSAIHKVTKFLENFGNKTINEIKSKANAAKAFVDEKLKNLMSTPKSGSGMYMPTIIPENIWEQVQEKTKYLHKEKLANGKTRYFYSEKEYQSFMKKLNYQKNEPSFMKKVKETSDLSNNREKVRSEEDDVKATNPNYNNYKLSNSEDYSTNCSLCTATYELRCRGYDVEAKPDAGGTSISRRSKEWYENGKVMILNSQTDWPIPFTDKKITTGKKFETTADVDRVTKKLLDNNPPGSRGDISVTWTGLDSGHSMVYEVTPSNKIVIRDAQTNKELSLSDLAGQVDDIMTMRTDNLKLKKGIMEAFDEKPNTPAK